MGLLRCSIALVFGLLLRALPDSAQSLPAAQPSTPAPRAARSESGLLMFRVTTREVVVDVIAVDGHNHPVTDLQPADLEVSSQTPSTTEKRRHADASGSSTTGVITLPYRRPGCASE